jgi:hypothetical protein
VRRNSLGKRTAWIQAFMEPSTGSRIESGMTTEESGMTIR